MGAMVQGAFRKLLATESSLRRRSRMRLVWLLVAAILVATPLLAQAPGTWEPAAGMTQGRAGHTATLLSNGKALIAGGKDARGNALATAELYDPATGLYVPVTAPLPTPVWGHTATLLDDGTVLLVGGQGVSGRPVSAAQLFDPATSTFTALTPMSTPRSQHTVTLLRDGWVLIAGGTNGVSALATLELYYLGIGFFPAPNPLLTPRQGHTATLLPDGRVLVVSGSNASEVLNSAELYDPKDDSIVAAGALSFARTQASAALLLDGTVLVAGGQDSQYKDLYSAEVYAPLTHTFTLLTALMTTARSGHVGLTLLHNGKMLIAGGTRAGKPVATTEVYDPVLSRFWEVGALNTARQLFGANFFAVPYTGTLLVSGGLDHKQKPLASSELFFFPTLRSDKLDYSPGEIVTLLGQGWGPNETVTITIRESSGDPDTTLTATADGSGTFTNGQFQISPGTSDLGVRFLVTAVGQQSKWTAQTVFTDGNVKVFARPSGVTFTLTSQIFNTLGCSGSSSSPDTDTVGSSAGETFGVGSTQSVKLQAANTSNQGKTFSNWTTDAPGTITIIDPQTICVPGFTGGGTRNYFANYVNKVNQAVLTLLAGTPLRYNMTETLSTSGGSGTGAVSFSLTSGPCTLTGAQLTAHSGSGSCVVSATKAGDANYNPATASATVALQKANQAVLTLLAGTPLRYNMTETLSTSGGSGTGAVSFSLTSGPCTLTGTQLTAHSGSGSCVVSATKAGDANYNPATASATVALQKADQTIMFGALLGKTLGDPDFSVSASASSGLPVSFAASGTCTISGNTVHITGAGTCTITASQGGNDNYLAAPDVPQSFEINTRPEVQTLSLSPPSPGTNNTLTASATTFDADGNSITLTYVWKNGTTTVQTTANTSSLTDTLDLSVAGKGDKGDTITVEVTPNDGRIDGSTASVSVTVVNSPPILSVTNQTGSEGVLLTFQLSVATDPDGDTLTYSASNLPTGATFDSATRTFTWTPTSAQGGPGPYLVQFTVSDGQITDTKVASIAVNDNIADSDGDGIPDAEDNCPDQYNPDGVDVCNNSQGTAVTSDATISPDLPTDQIPVDATFTFTRPTNAPPVSVVPPHLFNVICRATSNVTGQVLEWQTVAEGKPIILSNQPDGDLVPLVFGANVFNTTFDLKTWYPNLPPGSYTVVCTYVNFAHIPVPEAGDPIIWMGTVDAPPQIILIGIFYTFGGFSSPADHEPFNQGRTVPVKFQLRDSAGDLVTTATVRLFVQRLQNGMLVGPRIPATPAGGGTGNTVPFNGSDYHYNMKTNSLAVGEWQLQAQLGDGTIQVITIVIR